MALCYLDETTTTPARLVLSRGRSPSAVNASPTDWGDSGLRVVMTKQQLGRGAFGAVFKALGPSGEQGWKSVDFGAEGGA
eukprot:gene24850-39939_t